jgi:hypothetical protein
MSNEEGVKPTAESDPPGAASGIVTERLGVAIPVNIVIKNRKNG